MSRRKFLDVSDGDTVTYDVVTEDGYRLCPFFKTPEETQTNFLTIPNRKCRQDDIFLNSYPKTGTHWIWEIVRMILLRQTKVSNMGKDDEMIEDRTEEALDAIQSPRIINTHVSFKYIPKEAIEKKIKCILVCRNPKDTAVSFYNHMAGITEEAMEKKIKCILVCRNPKDTAVSFYNHTAGITAYQYDGKFSNFLQMFMRGEVDYGSYPKYLLEWQQAIREHADWPIHVLYYEDMKANSMEEIKRLSAYLEVDISDELVADIADTCNIAKMKRVKAEVMTDEVRKINNEVFRNGYTMTRKGQVGDWKNWFTVAQNEMFDTWWTNSTPTLEMFQFKYTI